MTSSQSMEPHVTTAMATIELPDPGSTPTITVERAGEILGLCRQSAYSAVNRGEIPSLRFGRRLVVPTAQFLQLLGIPQRPTP